MQGLVKAIKYGVAALIIGAMILIGRSFSPHSVFEFFRVFMIWGVLALLLTILLIPDMARASGDYIGRRLFFNDAHVFHERDFSQVRKKVGDERYDEALEDLRSELGENPGNWPVIREMARIHDHHLNEPDRAITLYKRCLERGGSDDTKPMSPTTRANLSFRLADLFEHEKNDPDRALEYLERIRSDLPGDRGEVKRAEHRIHRIRQDTASS